MVRGATVGRDVNSPPALWSVKEQCVLGAAVAQERGDGLSLGTAEKPSRKRSALSWVLQGSFWMWTIPWPCFFWGGGWGWGIRPVLVVFICKLALRFFLVHTLGWCFSSPPCLYRQVSTVQIPATNSVPSNFTACLFNCTYISEELGRECRIHLLIYMHWESCVSEIKILLRLNVLIQVTQRTLWTQVGSICNIGVAWRMLSEMRVCVSSKQK